MLREVTTLDQDGHGSVRFTLEGGIEVTAAVAVVAAGIDWRDSTSKA